LSIVLGKSQIGGNLKSLDVEKKKKKKKLFFCVSIQASLVTAHRSIVQEDMSSIDRAPNDTIYEILNFYENHSNIGSK
jgi:hypothetical protein